MNYEQKRAVTRQINSGASETWEERRQKNINKTMDKIEAARLKTERRLAAMAAKQAEIERRKAQLRLHDALVKEIKAAIRRGASAEEITALQAKLFGD